MGKGTEVIDNYGVVGSFKKGQVFERKWQKVEVTLPRHKRAGRGALKGTGLQREASGEVQACTGHRQA